MLRRTTLLLCLLMLPHVAKAQEAAPALSLEDLNGNQQNLADLRGRIVILNFWATWCVPCREEMPMLARLHREYEARGITVIGASADDASTQEKIAPFVQELALPFPIWKGATTADMERFGLGTALPATAVLDREGGIAFRILGPLEEAGLRARIQWLLAGRKGTAPEATLNKFEKHAHEQEGHDHKEGEDHQHGGVAMEGASSVPS